MDLFPLHQLFGQSSVHLTAGQESARAVVVFFYGWLLLRLAGRRIFGRWAALDIVVSIMVGSNLSRALTGSAPLLATLVGTTALVGLHWIAATLAVYWRPLDGVIEGKPVQIVRGGQMIEAAMRRLRVTHSDLEEALRDKGLDDLAAVRTATLEPSGKISILRQ